jgi:hypothetical protein
MVTLGDGAADTVAASKRTKKGLEKYMMIWS